MTPSDLARSMASEWEAQRYGDQGLRLRAEATIKLLRQLADHLEEQHEKLESRLALWRDEARRLQQQRDMLENSTLMKKENK